TARLEVHGSSVLRGVIVKRRDALVGGIDARNCGISGCLRCFRTATRGVRNSRQLFQLARQALSVGFNLAEFVFSGGGSFFEWRSPRFNRARNSHVCFVKPDLLCGEFTGTITASFNLNVQAAQDAGLSVVAAA